MKITLRGIILLLLLLNTSKTCFSLDIDSPDVTIASVISSGMVLQQQSDIKIWGTGVNDLVISIDPDWTEEVSATITNGEWMLSIATPAGSYDHHSIDIYKKLGTNDKELLKTIDNILIGEVWLAAGQSNMKMTMADAGYEALISQSEDDAIRYFKITEALSNDPQISCGGQWLHTTPTKTGGFSAVSWFFAKALKQKLDVPIGVINASYGDSPIEAWNNAEVFEQNESLGTFYLTETNTELPHRNPSVLYNAMLHPIIPYTLNGVIWYQGESSYNDIGYYAQLQAAMINDWRIRWSDNTLPIYYVQIAPYLLFGNGNGGPSPNQTSLAIFREEQEKALSLIDHSGMVPINDIGDYYDIHPTEKQKVGNRLANFALAERYSEPIENYKSALVESITFDGSDAIISFKDGTTGSGIKPVEVDSYIPGLWIAGADKIFFPGKLSIDGTELHVSSDSVNTPVAVRYGFYDCIQSELQSNEGLPIAPFRNDTWGASEIRFVEFQLYDLISDFDIQNVSPYNMWGNLGYKLKENPNKSGINLSEQVVEISTSDFGYEGFNYKTSRQMEGAKIAAIKLKVFANDASAFNSMLIKMEDSYGIEPEQTFEVHGLYPQAGSWDTVHIDIDITGNANFDIITFMPNIWETNTTSFYLDDIEVEEQNGVRVPAAHIQELKIYPNPVENILTIEGLELIDTSWSLYGLTGAIQKTGLLKGNSISTANLTPGIYFLHIQEEIYKIVKQ